MEDKKRYKKEFVALALYCPVKTVAIYCQQNGIGKGGMTIDEIYDFSKSHFRYWKGHDEVEEIKHLLGKRKDRQREQKQKYGTRVWRVGDEE